MRDCTYPQLHRHQWHNSHGYTLMVASGVEVHLSADQLESLREQIEEDRRPMSDEELYLLRSQLDEIRAARST